MRQGLHLRGRLGGSRWLAAAAIALFAVASPAQEISVERVAAGLSSPLFLTAPPEDPDRVFIVERAGRIRILRLADDSLEPAPFLNVGPLSTVGELGLLGLAFHPDYAQNGYLYVYLATNEPLGGFGFRSRVVRFEVSAENPDVADPTSELPILEFSQPQGNHNGGWIGFGPDGFLYIASGDGGNFNDTGPGHTTDIGNAQDLTDNLLGKMLRLDVDGDDFPGDPGRNYAIPAGNPFSASSTPPGDPEIWSYGLRNPFRASFDRVTGDLYIGDVGQNDCEEIDFQPATSAGGENYGWRLREGTIATPAAGIGGAKPPGAVDPIFAYPHPGQGCPGPGAGFAGRSVTGGQVYRGPIASLVGRYFFADFITGQLWSFVFDGSTPGDFDGTNFLDLRNHATEPEFTPDEGTIGSVAALGEDAAGNLYVVDLGGDEDGGEVFRVPEPASLALSLCALASVGLVSRLRRRLRRPRARAPRDQR